MSPWKITAEFFFSQSWGLNLDLWSLTQVFSHWTIYSALFLLSKLYFYFYWCRCEYILYMYPQSPDEDIRFVELVIGSCELSLGSGNQTDPPEKQPVFWTSKSSTEKKKKGKSSTGLNTSSPVKEREDGLYEQGQCQDHDEEIHREDWPEPTDSGQTSREMAWNWPRAST